MILSVVIWLRKKFPVTISATPSRTPEKRKKNRSLGKYTPAAGQKNFFFAGPNRRSGHESELARASGSVAGFRTWATCACQKICQRPVLPAICRSQLAGRTPGSGRFRPWARARQLSLMSPRACNAARPACAHVSHRIFCVVAPCACVRTGMPRC